MGAMIRDFVINFLNLIIPKKSNRIVIVSFPDFDDQTRAVTEDLLQSEIIVLVSDIIDRPLWLNDDVIVVKRTSLTGLWYLVTSDLILLTHGLSSNFKLLNEKRQLVINLTHGMYVKNMHLLLGETSAPKFHYILSVSQLFSDILSRMFALPIDRVLVSGIPRNRFLTRETKCKLLLDLKSKYSKVTLWMPTYRKTNVAGGKVDVDTVNVFGNVGLDLNRLNTILELNGELLIIKPHPMASYDAIDKYSNISIVTNDNISKDGFSLYELVAISDVLLTDYSSIFVDFMVTKRPVIFVMFDEKEYEEGRGTTIDHGLHVLPGEKVTSTEGLYNIFSRKGKTGFYNMSPFVEHGVCDNFTEVLNSIRLEK
ncbi:CDP-glycerol glycerophosphotransferase family protein [Pseudomonadota bacterium]